MATFDYPFAEPPSLKALEASYAGNDVEREIKALTIALFIKYISEQAYDVNVAGAAHLGSFDLVRRTVNQDGLTLLQGDREESSTRYLYRAWRSRDLNGRGMHFLRTYLQMLFPNICQVAQMWQDKDSEYPLGLHSTIDDDGEYVIDEETQWLTSRVEIALDLTVETRSILALTNIFRSILPARLVPQFRFWIRGDASLNIWFDDFGIEVTKESNLRKPWCGRVITDRPDAKWKLGKNDLSSPNTWKLRACRINGDIRPSISNVIKYRDMPRVGEPGRKLDGTWKLPIDGHLVAVGDIVQTE